MSLVKTYSLQCARCDIQRVSTFPTPKAARDDAQRNGRWQRLARIYTTHRPGQPTGREISGACEDYCPDCAPLVRAEYREIKAREAAAAAAS